VGALIGTFGTEHVRLAIELGIEPKPGSRVGPARHLDHRNPRVVNPALETSLIRLDEPCSDRTGGRYQNVNQALR
jgi:hypothetical protein